jgi:hypothetical protein
MTRTWRGTSLVRAMSSRTERDSFVNKFMPPRPKNMSGGFEVGTAQLHMEKLQTEMNVMQQIIIKSAHIRRLDCVKNNVSKEQLTEEFIAALPTIPTGNMISSSYHNADTTKRMFMANRTENAKTSNEVYAEIMKA